MPTTHDDVLALRRHCAPTQGDWLENLATLANQMPKAEVELRRRRTFAGLPPFEL